MVHFENTDITTGTMMTPVRLISSASSTVSRFPDIASFCLSLMVVNEHCLIDRSDIYIAATL